MRFSCQETEAPGFIHDVFECAKCRSIQSYVTPVQMKANPRVSPVTERRKKPPLRTQDKTLVIPSEQQLSLFVKRVRRAMQDAKSRHFFCIQSDEDLARGYPDVLRVLEWIEEAATTP
jgi:hypothetical protein